MSATTLSSAPSVKPRASLNLRLIQVGAIIVVIALLGTLAASFALADQTPGDRSPEAGFARDMITHHDQAVKMALLIRDRTGDEYIKSLATDMVLTQTNQIGQMTGWLQVWGLPMTGLDAAMTWMGHGGMPMFGMASPEELALLTSLQGSDAEVLFLQLMIRHHEGALPMAQAVLDASDNPQTERLASAILNSQLAEIGYMEELLAERSARPFDS